MNIGIIGAGAWGTALAVLSAESGNNVTLWSYDGNNAEFDGVTMPNSITVTDNMADLKPVDLWLVVTPAAFFRETLKKARNFYREQPVIICTKGIEPNTHKFMSEVLIEEIPECSDYGVLSGPQFAGEVASKVPTGSTLAGTVTVQMMGRRALGNFYLEESDDVIGAEICGVGKNAVALIMGYYSIKGRGENEKALVLTRAWNEVVKFGKMNGARTRTFLGLCGLGDLFLSATSKTSRNFSAGVAIANGADIVGTVEGISALNGLVKRAADKGVPIPVLRDMQSKLG